MSQSERFVAAKLADLSSATPTGASADPVTFDSPPVNEVVFAVQFDRHVIDEVGILSRYLPTIQADFPQLEKQPPLPPMQEDFEHPPEPGGAQIQLMQGPPSTRYWFISADQTMLIQVQSDRFMLNWRQTAAGNRYPRYRKALRPAFQHHFSGFLDHISGDPEPPAPNLCELTYINHIEAAGTESPGTHGPLAHLLRALDPEPVSTTLPPVEDTQLQQRFLIAGADGSPTGRLYLSAVPAYRNSDATPIYVVTLLARGRPTPPTPAGALKFFDMGRELIVRGFKESTTPTMHDLWGLHGDS